MVTARQIAEWDRWATMMALIASACSGKSYSPSEFHPYREQPTISVATLKAMIERSNGSSRCNSSS